VSEVIRAFSGDDAGDFLLGEARPAHIALLKAHAGLPNCGKCSQALNGPISAPSLRRIL
jgi:hypothetical protein